MHIHSTALKLWFLQLDQHHRHQTSCKNLDISNIWNIEHCTRCWSLQCLSKWITLRFYIFSPILSQLGEGGLCMSRAPRAELFVGVTEPRGSISPPTSGEGLVLAIWVTTEYTAFDAICGEIAILEHWWSFFPATLRLSPGIRGS